MAATIFAADGGEIATARTQRARREPKCANRHSDLSKARA
jgi:hypothetical protein